MENHPLFTRFSNTFSYSDYKQLMQDLVKNGSTTGDENTTEKAGFTRLNAKRMQRVENQVKINSELKEKLENIEVPLLWVVISETWCGDSAQNIPVLAKLAQQSPNIEFRVLLRDENPEIMDRYLTNGKRAIPKMICLNKTTGEELVTWGPRPAVMQEKVSEVKSNDPGVAKEEIQKNLHLWYVRDKGRTLQNEIHQLLNKWEV